MASGAFYINRQSSPPVPPNSMLHMEDINDTDRVFFYNITLSYPQKALLIFLILFVNLFFKASFQYRYNSNNLHNNVQCLLLGICRYPQHVRI